MEIPRLRQWRETRALTQEELAEAAGVSARSVAGYEAGAGARPGTVRKLAAALGVQVTDLFREAALPKADALPKFVEEAQPRERNNWPEVLRWTTDWLDSAERLVPRIEDRENPIGAAVDAAELVLGLHKVVMNEVMSREIPESLHPEAMAFLSRAGDVANQLMDRAHHLMNARDEKPAQKPDPDIEDLRARARTLEMNARPA